MPRKYPKSLSSFMTTWWFADMKDNKMNLSLPKSLPPVRP